MTKWDYNPYVTLTPRSVNKLIENLNKTKWQHTGSLPYVCDEEVQQSNGQQFVNLDGSGYIPPEHKNIKEVTNFKETLPYSSWDKIWMDLAQRISLRSHHPIHKVGCVIVTEDNCSVLSIGYSGNEKGGPNKPDSIEPGQSNLIHAEINSLIKNPYNDPRNKKMYITLSPCVVCARAIVNANIKEVIYLDEYRDSRGLDILLCSDVIVRKM